MSVTLKFNRISEKYPDHHQGIIFLNKIYAFDSEGFDPRECLAQWDWVEIDDVGEETGTSATYDPNDPELDGIIFKPGDIFDNRWKLIIIFDGYIATSDSLWMDVNDYHEAFDEDSKSL